ncbi:MAG: lipoate--protein ligase family protein [Candidatus Freyarchaeota archaeon]
MVFREVNLEVCTEYGLTIVRRFTGRGTVYHDLGNLNWTVVVDRNHMLVPRVPAEIYRVVSNAIIEGIKLLGMNAEFKPPNVIQIREKKISGLAAYVKKNAILCHGTLLVDADLDILSKVLKVDHKFCGQTLSRLRSSSSHVEVTTLRHELNSRLPISLVKESILLGFDKLYNITPKLGKLNDYEEEMAQTLYHEKYARKEWNFRGKLG